MSGHFFTVAAQKRPGFVVLSADTLAVEHSGPRLDLSVVDLKYTLDSGTLAVACSDHNIYCYNASAGYTLASVLSGVR